MFTRRGDTKSERPFAEPSLTHIQLQEAKAAVANQNMLAAIQQQAVNQVPPMPAHDSGATTGISIVPTGPIYVEGETPSVIGEDLTIEGQSITIRCRGALEINGKIQAELHSQKLVVGISGLVEGTITADSIDVWGRVSGTIMGARVTLHPSAEVDGDIHAKTLSVSDGASFEGRSRKVTDPATIAPRLDPNAAPAHTGAPIPVPRALQTQTTAVN